MIRRLLVAVVLLGSALLVLDLTIGFENFASDDLSREGQTPEIGEEEPAGRTGVVVGGVPGSDDAAISVSGRGRFEYQRTEPREFPSGEVRYLPVYSIVAKNSETVADDLLRLMEVEVRLHRIEDEPEPHAVHIGTVEAREALVQVGRDERGNPSIREDRDMDLYGVRLYSTPDARVRGLKLAVERLAVRQTELGTGFRTPTASEPFHVELGGDRPAQLDGYGITGFVPSKEAVEGQLELHVRSRPILASYDLVLSAEGPLDYTEDLRTGAGLIETNQNVEVRGFGLGGSKGDTVATGESLSATLIRVGEDTLEDGERASWGRLVLRGSKASLVTDAIELNCDVLSVAPSLDGTPAVFTAVGTPAVIDRRTGTTFRADDRIHLIDVPSWFGAIHRDAGFGSPVFPEIAGQLVVFEGTSRIEDEERGLEITASEGLRVLRSAAAEGPLMAVGAGEVLVASADLTVQGGRGFELRRSEGSQVLRLGPVWPDAAHTYRIEHRSGEIPLTVAGSGSCRLERDAEGRARLTLVSTRDDIRLQRGEDILDDVRTLTATVDQHGGLQGLVAGGARCHVIGGGLEGGERVEGRAAQIESPNGRSFVLTGSLDQPAELARGPRDRLAAPVIELHRVAGNRAWLIARGEGGRAFVRVVGSEVEGRGTDHVELEANLVMLAPGIVPALVRRVHGLPGLGAAAADHVVASGRVVVVERDPTSERDVTRAEGSDFALAVRSFRGLLRGTPARIESVTPEGRRVFGRADRVQFAATERDRGALRLLHTDRFDPELDLRDDREGPFRNVRVSSDGNIAALPDGVRFGGPVYAVGLTEDGRPDKDALEVRAETLGIDWNADTRELRTIRAGGRPSFFVNGVLVSGDRAKVDVPATTLDVFSGPDTLASVALDGWRWTGSMFRVDYGNRRVQAWQPDLRSDGSDRVISDARDRDRRE